MSWEGFRCPGWVDSSFCIFPAPPSALRNAQAAWSVTSTICPLSFGIFSVSLFLFHSPSLSRLYTLLFHHYTEKRRRACIEMRKKSVNNKRVNIQQQTDKQHRGIQSTADYALNFAGPYSFLRLVSGFFHFFLSLRSAYTPNGSPSRWICRRNIQTKESKVEVQRGMGNEELISSCRGKIEVCCVRLRNPSNMN